MRDIEMARTALRGPIPCAPKLPESQARKKSTKTNFLGPETARWGGGLPNEMFVRALPRKFVFLRAPGRVPIFAISFELLSRPVCSKKQTEYLWFFSAVQPPIRLPARQ